MAFRVEQHAGEFTSRRAGRLESRNATTLHDAVVALLLDLHPAHEEDAITSGCGHDPVAASSTCRRRSVPPMRPCPQGALPGPVSGMSGRQRTVHLLLAAAVQYLVIGVSAAAVGKAYNSHAGVAFLLREGGTSAVSAVEIRIAFTLAGALMVPALCYQVPVLVHSVESRTGPIDDPERAPPLPGPAPAVTNARRAPPALPVCRARGDPDLGQSLP
jgi:hypothetical protein